MMVPGILRNLTVHDYTINYTISLNTSLEQVMVLLGKFQDDNNVLDNPAHTIIIVVYCVLVSMAGRVIMLGEPYKLSQ